MTHVHAIIVYPSNLTTKECEVLRLLCEGKTRAEIALRLHRTFSTVSKHIEAIAQKFDAHSAAEIVSVAVAHGMVQIKIVSQSAQRALIQCLLIVLLIAGQHMDVRQPPRLGRQSARLIRIRTENQQQKGDLWTS